MTVHADRTDQLKDPVAGPERPAARPARSRRPAGTERGRRRAVRVGVLAVLVAADLTMVIAWGAFHAVDTPTFHLDGAFQTASGLFRIQSGDLPGRDFYPYLGIGPVFLLYPAFAVTGGVLGSSVFSAWAVTAALLALLVGVLLALTLRLRSIGAVLAGAGLLLGLLMLGDARFAWTPPPVQALLAPLFTFSVPGNSLRPVRAAAPLLLVAVTVLSLTRLPRRAGLITTGAAFGVVIACWSNDFALAPSVVVLALVVHHGVRRRGWRVRELAVLAASLVAAAVVSGFVLTGGHYVSYAAYNFRDVLGDQFWYFGPWGTEARVNTLGDLLRFMVQSGAGPGIGLLIGLTVLVLVKPVLRWTVVAALGWAAFVGGTVALIGGHLDDYFLPLRVWTVVAGTGVVLLLLRLLVVRLAGARLTAIRTSRPLAAGAVVMVLLLVAAGAVKEVRTAVDQRATAAADPTQTDVPALGGHLAESFAAHVAAAPAAGTFVEEYAGLWTAVRGPHRQQKVDAVIHALGQERAPFARALQSKTVTSAVTTRPAMDRWWVSWNISANWWWYRELFHRFSPRITSPNTVVWRRQAASPTPSSGSCTVSANGQSILVTPAATGLNEVTVRYRGPGRGHRALSMLRNDIDGALDSNGFVALDPGATSQSVPVHVSTREPRRYGLRNIPDRRLTTITACSTASVPFPSGSDAEGVYGSIWAADTTPAAFTDGEYVNGVSPNPARFLVPNTPPNTAAYRIGSTVRLADGSVRRVLDLDPVNDLVAVSLSGGRIPQRALDASGPLVLTG